MDTNAYNCPCCLENMRDCKMLKCHHVVCKECYELMKIKYQNDSKNFLCPICRNVEIDAPPIIKKSSLEETQNMIIIIDDQGTLDYYVVNTNRIPSQNRKMLIICFITMIWALIVMPIIYLYYQENKI